MSYEVNIGVVIPVGEGRQDNLDAVIASLQLQSRKPDSVVIVEDGFVDQSYSTLARVLSVPKHEPGMEQPRNHGARAAAEMGARFVWFLDSDVVPHHGALEALEMALLQGPKDRILVAPYDWLPDGWRPRADCWPHWQAIVNDPRWEMFAASPPEKLYRDDLSAGLACFSGNLLWPLAEFARVGGFWNELHHGRCEDGELGLRAVAMGVGISFAAKARGFHLAHPVNHGLALQRNTRDVPMLNDRHPWVQQAGVVMTGRDGAAFDVTCRCGQVVPTIEWWQHAAACPQTQLELPTSG